MTRMILALTATVAIASAGAQSNTSWDGTWNGSWGGRTAAKIIVAGGRVVEYDYIGTPQKVGETTVSGDVLSFGMPPTFIVTLKRTNASTASAHYHGPAGDAEAVLAKQ